MSIILNKQLFDWLCQPPKRPRVLNEEYVGPQERLLRCLFADAIEEHGPFHDPNTFGFDYNPYVEQDII